MAYITMTNQTFDSLADLEKQAAGEDGVVVIVAYNKSPGDQGGGSYRWTSAAVNLHDGMNVVKVTGVEVGRWIRMKNNNYTTGNVSINMTTLLTKSFVVAHGLSFTPSAILLEATNSNAALGDRWITDVNSSTFTINFRALVALGTGTYNFVAIR